MNYTLLQYLSPFKPWLEGLSRSESELETFDLFDQMFQAILGHQGLVFTCYHESFNLITELYHSNAFFMSTALIGSLSHSGALPLGIQRLLSSQKIVVLNSETALTEGFPESSEFLRAQGLGSLLLTPIVYQKQTLGWVSVFNSEHYFTPLHESLAVILTQYLVPYFLEHLQDQDYQKAKEQLYPKDRLHNGILHSI